MKNMAQVMESGGNAYNVKYDTPRANGRGLALADAQCNAEADAGALNQQDVTATPRPK